jgi:hypothetical protein
MSSNTPAIVILLLSQPRMTKHLNVKIEDLKTRMVDMELGPFEKEKTMMVNPFIPSIQMEKSGDVLPSIWSVNQFAWLKVEMGRVELIGPLVVGDTKAEVAEFMDGSRSLFEALCLVDWTVLGSWKIV